MSSYLDLLDKHKADRAQGLVKAADAAIDSLKDLRAHLTKAKDMETAGVVNNEINRIGDLLEIVDARAKLAARP